MHTKTNVFTKEGATMLKIAVCDDEQLYLDKTRTMLEQYAAVHDRSITAEYFVNPSDLIDKLESGEEYDIYLLDIYMPGVTGMSVAAEIRKRNCESPIVFLTSSADHAVEAFALDAIHYLLKPYAQSDLHAAMDKAIRVLGDYHPKSILLKTTDGYYNISVSKIICCESDNHNQRIFLTNSSPIHVRISSADLLDKLTPFGYFYPCGKTYIINLERIDKLLSSSVLMENGDSFAVPRRAMTGLKNAWLDYLSRR